VVWDPDAKQKVQTTLDRFPEMSPFIGEELYGQVHRTYLRGALVFSSNCTLVNGRILTRCGDSSA
jgi:dihydroorotase-like cyclic amidohydrolase